MENLSDLRKNDTKKQSKMNKSEQLEFQYLLALLQQKGVRKKSAAKAVYSNRGPWNLSRTRVIEKVYSIEWFIKEGQKIVSGNLPDRWFGIEKWVKLT